MENLKNADAYVHVRAWYFLPTQNLYWDVYKKLNHTKTCTFSTLTLLRTLIFPVAQSSWNPLFLTHTSNPLANCAGSFFKIHPNLSTELCYTPAPNHSSCLDQHSLIALSPYSLDLL